MGKQQQLDVYKNWLGITETARPLNYYQLLRLKKFEDETSQIRTHFQRMSTHVRKFQQAAPDEVRTLLDELTKAMLCLTDSHRKGDYDASLGRQGGGETRKRSLEELLVGRKIIDKEQLAKAQSLAAAIGVDLRDAVIQQKLAKPEAVTQAYADSLGLPFVDLSQLTPDPELLPKLPAVLARQHSCVPLMIDQEKVLVASPSPLRNEIEDEIRLRMGMPVRTVLCTPAGIHEAISKYYTKEAAAAQIGVTLSSGQAKATKPKRDPVEMKKRRKNFTMIGGMMTFMAFSIIGAAVGWDVAMGAVKFYGAGLALGSVAAAIGWIVGTRT
jgi:hypothetical protein